jgi:hypothetical protein
MYVVDAGYSYLRGLDRKGFENEETALRPSWANSSYLSNSLCARNVARTGTSLTAWSAKFGCGTSVVGVSSSGIAHGHL